MKKKVFSESTGNLRIYTNWVILLISPSCGLLVLSNKMEHVIGGKFKLGRKIGSGSFGELYLGV